MNYQLVTRVVGTTTNDSADAGYVGEFMEAKRLAAAALSLTTATAATLTSITLTPGDWDVNGATAFLPAATTSVTILNGSSSLTTNTTAGADDGANFQWSSAANVLVQPQGYGLPTRRVLVAAGATTVVYNVALAAFTVSTMTSFGHIRARRMR